MKRVMCSNMQILLARLAELDIKTVIILVTYIEGSSESDFCITQYVCYHSVVFLFSNFCSIPCIC